MQGFIQSHVLKCENLVIKLLVLCSNQEATTTKQKARKDERKDGQTGGCVGRH